MITSNYENYKSSMHEKGWKNKLVTLNQDNDICKLVEISDVKKDTYSLFICFKHPEENVISIGTSDEYKFKLIIYDKNEKEIYDDTVLVITKHHTSTTLIQLDKVCYSNLRIGYSFKKAIELPHYFHIDIVIRNPKNDIPKENVQFEFTFDYWTKE